MTTWAEVEPAFRQEAYATLEEDPQSLLEVDGGPAYAKASLIYARLIGLDGEVVKDGWRLQQAEPHLLVPISRRFTIGVADPDPTDVGHPPTPARYVLQSGFVRMNVSPTVALPPKDVELDDQYLYSVLYLRYRRRL